MEQVNKKIITISSKRQITIPQKFYDSLGFAGSAECIAKDGGIFIKPLHEDADTVDFSAEILADLIDQGYTGKELLHKFVETKKKIRPAVEKMIKDAETVIYDESSKCSLDDLFAAEESPEYGK